jgi:hypothetical protein
MNIIKTVDEHLNLFFRAKGAKVNTKNGWRKQQTDAYIIQWQGSSDYDSGYHETTFMTLEGAIDALNAKAHNE